MLREVAVFDTINPGGFYAARVKPLGAYAAAAPGACARGPAGLPACGDIADPLYGNSGGADEAERLRAAVARLRAACAGLLAHLRQLHARCAVPGVGAGPPARREAGCASCTPGAECWDWCWSLLHVVMTGCHGEGLLCLCASGAGVVLMPGLPLPVHANDSLWQRTSQLGSGEVVGVYRLWSATSVQIIERSSPATLGSAGMCITHTSRIIRHTNITSTRSQHCAGAGARRCGPGMGLQRALAQALLCPLLCEAAGGPARRWGARITGPGALPRKAGAAAWRPVWLERAHAGGAAGGAGGGAAGGGQGGAEELWTLRVYRGQRQVVRRSRARSKPQCAPCPCPGARVRAANTLACKHP